MAKILFYIYPGTSAPSPSDIAIIMYTSGSTGGNFITQNNLYVELTAVKHCISTSILFLVPSTKRVVID